MSLAQEREALIAQEIQKKLQNIQIQREEETFQQNIKNQQDQETLEEGKQRLQQQRELIKQKRSKRDEMNSKILGGGSKEQKKPEQQEKDPLNVINIELIKYLQTERVANQKRAQELELKKQELRKRADIVEEIKSDALQQQG
ncbi:unnamed protein product [Paramecium octaurelia]|uniref:Uncharacterized protein n=1 Tax=Paramecium octaurelia TaxID=43137 RepID=A0A8S1RUD3_PAROT|nr:unnamed protein product [Paramecium octaurelia]